MESLLDLEKPYRDLLGFMPARVRERIGLGMEIDAAATTAIEALRAQLVAPQALDLKTSQLIAFGILLVNLSQAAENHALAALRAGASAEELHAAAGIAFLFRGLPAINLAGEVLRAALLKHQAGGSGGR
ncbi:MAG: carboxymuconolactone decarboxylase family protein [Betaproteobacteria bacterium]|nr:carboxymuconolactone decarboxylase family protein [Betaproteobacteria bacterium]